MFFMPNVYQLACAYLNTHTHTHWVHTHKHNCKLYLIFYLIKLNYYKLCSKFMTLIIYYVQSSFSTCKEYIYNLYAYITNYK